MDSEKREVGEIYKKLDAKYCKVMERANEKIKTIEDFIGVGGTCHFFSDKCPGEEEIDKIVEELLRFAVKSLKEDESNYICVKPDKRYPLLHKYLNGLTIERSASCTDWGCDFFIVT
jgi:hypothetical protein